MPTKTTISEAAKIVSNLILDANLPSHRADNRRDLRDGKGVAFAETGMTIHAFFGNPHVFGYECSLAIDVTNRTVQVSWSAMHRTPSQARANLALYTQVTDLAMLIQAFFENIEFKKG